MLAPPLQPSLARNGPRGGARNYVDEHEKRSPNSDHMNPLVLSCCYFMRLCYMCVMEP